MIAAARPGIRENAAVSGPFSDNFNRANDSTGLGTASDGGTWTTDGGTFGILTSRAYLSVTGTTSPLNFKLAGLYNAARRDSGSISADVSCDHTRSATGSPFAMLLVAYSPTSGDGYLATFDSSATVTLRRLHLASLSTVSTWTVTGWTSGTTSLRLVYVNATSTFTLYQGGTSVGARTDGTPIAAPGSWTGFGVQNTGSDLFDNFVSA